MGKEMKSTGGLTKGNSHAKGGIEMTVKSTGQKIEVEGGEGIINKHVMSSDETFDFEGKEMTACEIGSTLNQETGNGVSFDCAETKNTDMTPTDASTGFAKGGKTNTQVPITKVVLTDFDKKTYFGQYKKVFDAFHYDLLGFTDGAYELGSSGKRDSDGNYILLISEDTSNGDVEERLSKIKGILFEEIYIDKNLLDENFASGGEINNRYVRFSDFKPEYDYAKGGNIESSIKTILKQKYDPIKKFGIILNTDENSATLHLSDPYSYKEALEAYNAELGINEEWDSIELYVNNWHLQDVDEFAEYLSKEIDSEYPIKDELDDILDGGGITDYVEKYYAYDEDYESLKIDILENALDVNEETNDIIERLNYDLKLSQNGRGYTNIYHPLDDDVSISVRVKDHSQRFSNIKSDFSISFVVANKDATGSSNNQGRGFSSKFILAGASNHAQEYFNSSEFYYEEILENIKTAIKAQLDYALENKDIVLSKGGDVAELELSKSVDRKLATLGFVFNKNNYRMSKSINENTFISAFYNKNKKEYSVRGVSKFKTLLGGNSVGIKFDYVSKTSFWLKINELLYNYESSKEPVDLGVVVTNHAKGGNLSMTNTFKSWFGDSKVVDKQGNPLVVYHGSPDLRGLRENYIFESRFSDNKAFFFTDNYLMAKSYADPKRAFDYQNSEEGIIKLYVSLQNPLIVNAFNQVWRKFETTINGSEILGTRKLMIFAKDKGYDGVIVKNVRDYYNENERKTKGGNVYVAFEPNQIKLADGTNTTFDSDSNDIRLAKGGDVDWYNSPEGKGDPSITKRNAKNVNAASAYGKGDISYQEYLKVSDKESPIKEIDVFFEPATTEDIYKALSSQNQKIKLKDGSKVFKQEVINAPIEKGTPIGVRLDIPSYTRSNTWVVSVHQGHKQSGKPISYQSVIRLTNVTFGSIPSMAFQIAVGAEKQTIGRMYGYYYPIDGLTPEQRSQNTKELVESIKGSSNWKQVGMNPFRHSYFYLRENGNPIKSSEEVIQIGGLVYAKNPVVGTPFDEEYRIDKPQRLLEEYPNLTFFKNGGIMKSSDYAKGGKIESWKYKWGSWEAKISKHPRRNEYNWSVYDTNGNDTYDFNSDIDSELETPMEAENNMFRNINDRIGHSPKSQMAKYEKGGDIDKDEFFKQRDEAYEKFVEFHISKGYEVSDFEYATDHTDCVFEVLKRDFKTQYPQYSSYIGSYYAKGGEVEFYDKNSIENRSRRKIWEGYKNIHGQESVGSFSHTINNKLIGDYYLFLLDDFDAEFYSHLPLKDNEIIFRSETEVGRIGKSLPLVKVNIANGRVYFMSEDNDQYSDENDKNPKFDKSSVNVNYLSLDSSLSQYAKGGDLKGDGSQKIYEVYFDGINGQGVWTLRAGSKEEAKRLFKDIPENKDRTIGGVIQMTTGFAKGGIVEPNGNGVEINEIWNSWNSIKTDKQHSMWTKTVGSKRYGTYGQLTVIDVVELFEPNYPNNVLGVAFEKEIKSAIKRNKVIKASDYAKGGEVRTMQEGDSVLYKGKTHYIRLENGVPMIVDLSAIGIDGASFPLFPTNLGDDLTDMYGNRVDSSISFLATGGRLVGEYYYDTRFDKPFRVISVDGEKIGVEYIDKKNEKSEIKSLDKHEFEYNVKMGAWTKYTQPFNYDKGGEISYEDYISKTKELDNKMDSLSLDSFNWKDEKVRMGAEFQSLQSQHDAYFKELQDFNKSAPKGFSKRKSREHRYASINRNQDSYAKGGEFDESKMWLRDLFYAVRDKGGDARVYKAMHELDDFGVSFKIQNEVMDLARKARVQNLNADDVDAIMSKYSKGGDIKSIFKYYKVPNEQLWAIQECHKSFDDGFGTNCVTIRNKNTEDDAKKEVDRLNGLGYCDYENYARGGTHTMPDGTIMNDSEHYAEGGEVSKYKTGITKFGKDHYAVRVDMGQKQYIPKLLKDRFNSKEEAEAFAERLTKRNKGTYVGEDGYFAEGGQFVHSDFSDTKNYLGKELSLVNVYNEDEMPYWYNDAQATIDFYERQGKKAMVIQKGDNHALYVDKTDSQTLAKGGNVEEWKEFVLQNSSWFSDETTEDSTDNEILLRTRDNGDVGEEEVGQEDVDEAKNIIKKVLAKFPKTQHNIQYVDEFVHLSLMPNKTKEHLAEEKIKSQQDNQKRKSAELIAAELNITKDKALKIVEDLSYAKKYYKQNKGSRWNEVFSIYNKNEQPLRKEFNNAQEIFDFISNKDFVKSVYYGSRPIHEVSIELYNWGSLRIKYNTDDRPILPDGEIDWSSRGKVLRANPYFIGNIDGEKDFTEKLSKAISDFIISYKIYVLEEIPTKEVIDLNDTLRDFTITKNWADVPSYWTDLKSVSKLDWSAAPNDKALMDIVKPFVSKPNQFKPNLENVNFSKNLIQVTNGFSAIGIPIGSSDYDGSYVFGANTASAIQQFPDIAPVIPSSSHAGKPFKLNVYKLLQYTKAAINYVNSTTGQVVFKTVEGGFISFDANLVLPILNSLLRLGHQDVFAFAKRNKLTIATKEDYVYGKDLTILIMGLVPDSNPKLGAYNDVLNIGLSAYYDFGHNQIHNSDGSVADFSMKYEDNLILPVDKVKLLKKIANGRNALPILEYVSITDQTATVNDLYRFISIAGANAPNGMYGILNGVLYPTSLQVQSEYPLLPKQEGSKVGFTIDSDALKYYMELLVPSLGKDELRPIMTGILVDVHKNGKIYLVATDAHSLVRVEISKQVTNGRGLSVSSKYVLGIHKLVDFIKQFSGESVEFSLYEHNATISIGGNTYTSRTMDGNYPNYEAIIPQLFVSKTTIQIKPVKIALASASVKSFLKTKEVVKTVYGVGESIWLSLSTKQYINSESEVYDKMELASDCVSVITKDYYGATDNIIVSMPIKKDEYDNFALSLHIFKRVWDVCKSKDTLSILKTEREDGAYVSEIEGYTPKVAKKKNKVISKDIQKLKKDAKSNTYTDAVKRITQLESTMDFLNGSSLDNLNKRISQLKSTLEFL